LRDILDQERIHKEIKREVAAMFDGMFSSPGFTEVLKLRAQRMDQAR
jgi:hypothetical protein